MKIPKSLSEMTNAELKDERDRLSKLETEIEPWSIFTYKEKIEIIDYILKERDDAISEFHGGYYILKERDDAISEFHGG